MTAVSDHNAITTYSGRQNKQWRHSHSDYAGGCSDSASSSHKETRCEGRSDDLPGLRTNTWRKRKGKMSRWRTAHDALVQTSVKRGGFNLALEIEIFTSLHLALHVKMCCLLFSELRGCMVAMLMDVTFLCTSMGWWHTQLLRDLHFVTIRSNVSCDSTRITYNVYFPCNIIHCVGLNPCILFFCLFWREVR